MKDIEIVNIDYTGTNSQFKKEDKVDLTKIPGLFIIPEEGPFYGHNAVIYKGGYPLTPDVDYELVEPVADLEQKTGKSVFLYVLLKQHIVDAKGTLDFVYQKVGNPIISIKTLIDSLEEMVIKGKRVDWLSQVSGKPDTYYPAAHKMDISSKEEVIGFGGLVALFMSLTYEAKSNLATASQLLSEIQPIILERLNYVYNLKWNAIMAHFKRSDNPHGATAADFDAGNLANFKTATVQQDIAGDSEQLYSTPQGLKAAILAADPQTDDYISQGELPFSYYGSGIYLPPPITGTFEGLGSDSTNAAFCLENNGWVVGLQRCFDARVRNLYYIYNENINDRTAAAPWLATYVKYEHPVITAAGAEANLILRGSGNDVIAIGDNTKAKFWISAANSTFDPSAHDMKVLDMSVPYGVTGNDGWNGTNIAKVGDWVYVIVSVNAYTGDESAYYVASTPATRWQFRMYRFKYTDLLNPSLTTITPVAVNATFDNVAMDRRTNKVAFFPFKRVGNSSGRLTESMFFFDTPAVSENHARMHCLMIVGNPANKSQARLRIYVSPLITSIDPNNGTQRLIYRHVCLDYQWDVENNILTLNPEFERLHLDVYANAVNVPAGAGDRSVAPSDFVMLGNTGFSYVPGFGGLSIGSQQASGPPFVMAHAKFNRNNDVTRDYEYMGLPNLWRDEKNQSNNYEKLISLKSPFGISSFPRFYSDLYALTNGVRTDPIEIFYAENQNNAQQCFYRICGTGTENDYLARQSIQSKYISQTLYGREPTANYGTVDGLNYQCGMVNRPRRKNASSRQSGLFGYTRNNFFANDNPPYGYSWETKADGSIGRIVERSDGGIIVNLNLDYSIDIANKRLSARPNQSKQVYISSAITKDMVIAALGAHANDLADLNVSFFIAQENGTGGDQPFSMWQAMYHRKTDPGNARIIVGLFTWSVDGNLPDGTRKLKIENMTYPFANGENEFKPGVNTNIIYTGMSLNGAGYWGINDSYGLQVRYNHMEILDFESEGPQNLEQIWYPGIQFQTPGNAGTIRVTFRRRNNEITEATVRFDAGQAFNAEYGYQLQANKDHGWISGVNPSVSGQAMNLMARVGTTGYVLLGATYVDANWSVFINSEVTSTFHGMNVPAKQGTWDLRELTDLYKNQTFYLYCVQKASIAQYEVTKVLRPPSPTVLLVGIVTTGEEGITSIERLQPFAISGYPLSTGRDSGVPVSSGSVIGVGTYKPILRDDLYKEE